MATTDQTRSVVALDALELWVGDLRRTREMLEATFGFAPLAMQPEAADGEDAVWLACGGVRLVLRAGAAIASHVAVHGDTVADVALTCADSEAVARRARDHGLLVERAGGVPRIDMTGDGTIRHSLRTSRLVPAEDGPPAAPAMLAVDHVTHCVEHGMADRIAEAYVAVFGLERVELGDFECVGDVATGMRSAVLRSPGLTVVLTEPLGPDSRGQTQRFVDVHAGPGVQHAAIAYDDLCGAVEALRARGVRFLPAPREYYERSRGRLADRPLEWDVLQRLEILVDADDDGVLYQLFSTPIAERGTFFFELIQRAGASGFGANNVRALFSAVAAAQGDAAAAVP
jgi:4-hydroxyphenylpyruvate dioxygenase